MTYTFRFPFAVEPNEKLSLFLEEINSSIQNCQVLFIKEKLYFFTKKQGVICRLKGFHKNDIVNEKKISDLCTLLNMAMSLPAEMREIQLQISNGKLQFSITASIPEAVEVLNGFMHILHA